MEEELERGEEARNPPEFVVTSGSLYFNPTAVQIAPLRGSITPNRL